MDRTGNSKDGFLVMEYRSGNEQALVDLVKCWHKRFCEKAFFIVRDADLAKDIAQDSWRIILTKLNSLQDPNRFGGWAMRIVHSKSIDVLRKSAGEHKYKTQIPSGSVSDQEVYSEPTKLKSKLYQAIIELPETQQNVIRLFYLEEYSLKEISEFLNVNSGTVKSRLYHAREKLKSILKQYRYED